MKKAKPSGRSTPAKRTAIPKTIDEYLAKVPEPARTTLKKIRATIRSVVPAEAEECISYRIPTFKYKGMLVSFAAFSNHCSLFPMNSSLLDEFSEELKGFQKSKGTIRFPVDQPLPASIVKKLVRLRIAGNERKQR